MYLVSCSTDNDNVKPEGHVFQLLSQKDFADDCQYDLFDEQNHDFMTQGDLSNKSVARDVELAMQKTMAFFTKHLLQNDSDSDDDISSPMLQYRNPNAKLVTLKTEVQNENSIEK